MKNYTGSYICLGIVYKANKKENIIQCLANIIAQYKTDKYLITTYCNELDQDKEYLVNTIILEKLNELIASDYFTIKFEAVLSEKKTQIIISNSLLEEYYAIQMDFHEETFVSCLKNNYIECMYYLDNLVLKLFHLTKFEIAFCDNNANFESTPLEMMRGGYKNYSLSYLPNEMNRLNTIRQNWELDGFSNREINMVGKFSLD